MSAVRGGWWPGRWNGWAAAIAAFSTAAPPAAAQMTSLEFAVVESPALDGARFGRSGQYERLRGLAHGEVDPTDAHQRHLVNLANAPRNARGRVEYSAVVEIFRPLDMSRWNRALYHTVSNSGEDGPDERVLLERGFALVRVGWQGDLTPGGDAVVANLPVARNPDGSPLVGRALQEVIFDDQERVSTATLSYPAASLDPARATLTVRRDRASPGSVPSDLRWRYLSDREISIERPEGFDGGAIYELVYDAEDPVVMGLGFAAVRDVISFLRYDSTDASGHENPLASPELPVVTVSIGISEGGRMLRDFLYLGFNEDVRNRIVFDGMHHDGAGALKSFTNYAFAHPERWQRQHEDHTYPGDQFPFTYRTLRDPEGTRPGGLFERCARTSTCPRILHTDSEAELWQARASLVVTDLRGGDVVPPDNVRVYVIAGTQHGGGAGVHTSAPSAGICQNPGNPLPLRDIRTALTIALYEWVADGRAPPTSRFPTIAGGALVAPDGTGFPAVPGIPFSAKVNRLRSVDHSAVPPKEGGEYPVLVARVDADGNMIDGIRPPNLAAPIGTYTGWNPRRAGFAEGEQCSGIGSFIPFARTRAEREANGDPRLSLEERYGNHAAYARAVARAALELVGERLLLRADAEEIIRQAEESSVLR